MQCRRRNSTPSAPNVLPGVFCMNKNYLAHKNPSAAVMVMSGAQQQTENVWTRGEFHQYFCEH